ncbi:MAG TPA: ABC transporter permease, partial [Deltaproteobacteria bacterium]|nr:ABC transporter permease [Deltaproteobacteria bacterium]
MPGHIRHIYRLGLKELISFRYDPVLIVLLVYCFTVMVVVPSKGTGLQMRNSSVAIVDEDGSPLSSRIRQAIGKPYFIEPKMISYRDIDRSLDRGIYT